MVVVVCDGRGVGGWWHVPRWLGGRGGRGEVDLGSFVSLLSFAGTSTALVCTACLFGRVGDEREMAVRWLGRAPAVLMLQACAQNC